MRIKNWKKFQHFKDRRPPWIKLYRDLLDDKEWHDMDPKAAKLLVMLWLIASESDNGELPAVDVIAFRIRIDVKACTALLSQLSHWLDIDVISSGYQDDPSETEGEIEKEVETDTRVVKVKRVTKPYGECSSVMLTDKEYAKLREEHGESKLNAGIESLDSYKASKGVKYVNDYAVLKKGSWVWTRVQESTGKSSHGSTGLINTFVSGNDESMMQQAREAGFE
jgi:hypothetical protein